MCIEKYWTCIQKAFNLGFEKMFINNWKILFVYRKNVDHVFKKWWNFLIMYIKMLIEHLKNIEQVFEKCDQAFEQC